MLPKHRTAAFKGASAYLFSITVMVAAIVVTRLTWPFLARAPFALMFLGVYLGARYATRESGWVAIALAAATAPFVASPNQAPQFFWQSIVVFVGAASVGNLIISSRNRVVEALQKSEAELRATWEHAALGSALLNRNGKVERVNPAMVRILGYPTESWVGAPFNFCSEPTPATGTEVQRFTQLITGAKPYYQREQRYKRQDGEWVWGRVTISAITAANGPPTGALMVLEDITDRRRAEADLRASEHKLRQAQKMEAVGQLVAGVAHNFNNLLTITMGYTDLLIEARRPGDPDREALEEIRKATARGAGLTRQLLTFSRQREASTRLVDVNSALSQMHGMLTRAVREDIVLTIAEAPSGCTIVIDPQDFEQVILNLVINARDALPKGGHIAVDTARQRFDAGALPEDFSVLPGDYVRVSVRDDGVGMSTDVQRHLFEPFFTTKEVGEGTGLGLATVYGVVRRHQGGIRVVTAPGSGTTVTLFFPFAEQPVKVPETVEAATLEP
jgi:two-component system cell cycle sensor histidine kinase/response regulator CckA